MKTQEATEVVTNTYSSNTHIFNLDCKTAISPSCSTVRQTESPIRRSNREASKNASLKNTFLIEDVYQQPEKKLVAFSIKNNKVEKQNFEFEILNHFKKAFKFFLSFFTEIILFCLQ